MSADSCKRQAPKREGLKHSAGFFSPDCIRSYLEDVVGYERYMYLIDGKREIRK